MVGSGVNTVDERRDVTAIVLAAGKGSRMESRIHKQYLELEGCPLICHALAAFERSPVNRIILVTGGRGDGVLQEGDCGGLRIWKSRRSGGRRQGEISFGV